MPICLGLSPLGSPQSTLVTAVRLDKIQVNVWYSCSYSYLSFLIISRVPDGALRSSGTSCKCSKGAAVASYGCCAKSTWLENRHDSLETEGNLYLAYQERETFAMAGTISSLAMLILAHPPGVRDALLCTAERRVTVIRRITRDAC